LENQRFSHQLNFHQKELGFVIEQRVHTHIASINSKEITMQTNTALQQHTNYDTDDHAYLTAKGCRRTTQRSSRDGTPKPSVAKDLAGGKPSLPVTSSPPSGAATDATSGVTIEPANTGNDQANRDSLAARKSPARGHASMRHCRTLRIALAGDRQAMYVCSTRWPRKMIQILR
jgi:hypothetical protein